MNGIRKIAITGGGGYVGSELVKILLEEGKEVKVLDLFIYGEDVFGEYNGHDNLTCIKGDIRNKDDLREAFSGSDAVIHLACISNDPSFDLNPELGKSINLDSFDGILSSLEETDVKRLIYASSSSVYGVREESDVREETPKNPLTDYSRFKLMCEEKLSEWENPNKTDWTIIRPATVCGYGKRLRLDLTVNLLTIHALINNSIKVFGGKQLRPNIHINDMVRVYTTVLEADSSAINGKIFNAGYQNRSVGDIALMVAEEVGKESIAIDYVPTDDIRSYHVNSDKIRRELGFETKHTIEDAITGIISAYNNGSVKDGMNNPIYYNIKRMQELNLS